MITSANDHINTLNPGLVTAEDAANFAPQQLVWDPVVTILYVVLAVVLFVGAYVLYNRRAVEKAGDTLLYPMVGNVIKALYAFLGGLAVGLFFWNLIAKNFLGFIIGAVIAAIIVHLVAEMLYSMDVDGVRRHYLSSIVGLALALAVCLGFQTGMVDLDHQLPDASRVKGAVIAYSGDNDGCYDVNSEFASDPENIEQILAAAQTMQEKNWTMADRESDEVPDLTEVTLAYRTAFGTNTRSFTLTADDAQSLMTPLLNEGNINKAAWASIASADFDDVFEMYVMPPFGDWAGGYETYLMQSPIDYSYDNGKPVSRVLDEEDGARRAEELFAAMQKDIAQRDMSVLQGRVVARIGYGIIANTDYGQHEAKWNTIFTVYEGDSACNALLAQWREEGFLADEAEQMGDLLKHYEADVYIPDADGDGSWTDLAVLNTEDFINAYLAGDLVEIDQANRYGVPVEDDIFVGLCDGPVEDDDTAIIANYRVRAGATLPGVTVSE